MPPAVTWLWPLLLLAGLISSGAASRQQKTASRGGGCAHESVRPLPLPPLADSTGQAAGPPDSSQRDSPQSASRRKRDPELIPGALKRSQCPNSVNRRVAAYSFGLGKRAPYSLELDTQSSYSFGLGKRAPYSFGLGKRVPYSFGLGKRAPFSSWLGKRTPDSFDLRKRRPYGFGLGKRSWSSWFCGPTRDLLKWPTYNFGLGKRSVSTGQFRKSPRSEAGKTVARVREEQDSLG